MEVYNVESMWYMVGSIDIGILIYMEEGDVMTVNVIMIVLLCGIWTIILLYIYI